MDEAIKENVKKQDRVEIAMGQLKDEYAKLKIVQDALQRELKQLKKQGKMV